MVELFGKEASGKTTLALHVVKEAQRKGGLYLFMVLAVLFGVYPSSKFYIIWLELWLGLFAGCCAYIDAENAFNPSVAEAIGVNVEKLLIAQPDSAENSLSIVNTLVGGSIDVVVVDSVCFFRNVSLD